MSGAVLSRAAPSVTDISVTQWTEAHRFVPEIASPEPGPYRAAVMPWQREPQDCLHPDHPARRVTARWAAGMGKTTVLENWIAFTAGYAPTAMMVTVPTLDEVRKFDELRIEPMIDVSPALAHCVAHHADSANHIRLSFRGGYCIVIAPPTTAAGAVISMRNVAFDNVVEFPKPGPEGDPRDLVRARQKMWGDQAKEWQASVAGEIGSCAISADYEAGDQRQFYLQCPQCDAWQPLLLRNLRAATTYVDDAGKTPVGAHFVCDDPDCDNLIEDDDRAELLGAGRWIPRRWGAPDRIAKRDIDRWTVAPCAGPDPQVQPSYHIWSAYHPYEPLVRIIDRLRRAQRDATRMRIFMQQDLAEPYGEAAARRVQMSQH